MNGSRGPDYGGDIVLAFSTGNRVPHYLDPLFRTLGEATEEAILNALTMATTTAGRDGNTA